MAQPAMASDLASVLLEIAGECVEQGPTYAQEMIVLRMAEERLHIQDDLEQQQRLLTAWHDLFRSGKLSWGYNVDNPGAPFFHIARR